MPVGPIWVFQKGKLDAPMLIAKHSCQKRRINSTYNLSFVVVDYSSLHVLDPNNPTSPPHLPLQLFLKDYQSFAHFYCMQSRSFSRVWIMWSLCTFLFKFRAIHGQVWFKSCKIDHSEPQHDLVSAYFPTLLQTLIGMALSRKTSNHSASNIYQILLIGGDTNIS